MELGTTTMIVLKELAENPPPHLNAIQGLLEPHLEFLTTFWISVWVMTAIVVVLIYVREYRKSRGNRKTPSAR